MLLKFYYAFHACCKNDTVLTSLQKLKICDSQGSRSILLVIWKAYQDWSLLLPSYSMLSPYQLDDETTPYWRPAVLFPLLALLPINDKKFVC